MFTFPRRWSHAAAFVVLALFLAACGNDPVAPPAAPRASRSATSVAAAASAEILTGLAAGKCADVSGGFRNPGTRLIEYTCHGGVNQQFTLPAAGTTGPILVYDGSTCVDASGGLGRDGDAIIIFPCNGRPNQQWTVTATGQITGINGKCLDVTGADSTDGTRLILYRCNGGPNQRWALGTAPVLARDLVVVRGDQAGVAAGPALVATFNVSSTSSAVATLKAPDGSVRTSAPATVVSGHARVVFVGLRPNTPYMVAGVAQTGGTTASTSAPVTGTTGSLPTALVGVHLSLTSGAPNGGYVLAPASSGHGLAYAVAFDTTGTLVWYREFVGTNAIDIQQQKNGHFTVFTGDITGSGAFHEFDSQGNDLHDWTAPSGYATDGHEIVLLTDATGQTTGAMLFGRHSVPMDLSNHGGSANGTIQTNTVFRITTAGVATALFTGTDRFTAADWISPSLSASMFADFDHPNAITLTSDGGFAVSWRNMKAITKHDASGHFQWQLGGRQATLTYAGDSAGGFDGQHFLRALPNGDFTILDNGQLHSPPESRGLELRVDAAAGTATVVQVVHDQSETLITPYQGSNERLTNGNSVIDYAMLGRIIEFDPSSNIVWQGRVVNASGSPLTMYRAFRIASLERYVAP
ncbi:MAG TPA: ricin-type beta-trefoil lectin domain protein [Gemmatirosa sp.]